MAGLPTVRHTAQIFLSIGTSEKKKAAGGRLVIQELIWWQPGALACAVRGSLKRVPSAPGYVVIVQKVTCCMSMLFSEAVKSTL
jgi:hypothetical protein